MLTETEIALKNYDWLVRNRGVDFIKLDWVSGSVVYGDGGSELSELCRPGFTSATESL